MSVKWVLGIDVGTKKTGVAVGQSVTGLAKPLALLRMPVRKLKPTHFRNFVQEWSIDYFVLGLPKSADGQTHPLAFYIFRLGQALEIEYNSTVYFIDETLSSHEARQFFGKRDEYDSAAAAVMVETFFSQNNRF